MDGLDPMPKLFITLHYYEIVSSVYVDMDLNKHTYIPLSYIANCYKKRYYVAERIGLLLASLATVAKDLIFLFA